MAVIEMGNVIEGASPATGLRESVVTLTIAQMRALNTTARTIIPAPGAGYGVVLETLDVQMDGTTAFGGIAAGEDLRIRYDGTTADLCVIETTGFLDQTDRPARHVVPTTTAAREAPSNTAIEVDNSGAITGGSAVTFTSHYRIVKAA